MLCIQQFKVKTAIFTANLEEPQCMPIMQTLVNLFYLSLMTDTLQEDGGIGGEPARGSPMQATTGQTH